MRHDRPVAPGDAGDAGEEELTGLVVDELVPLAWWYHVLAARRLGLAPADLACLDLLERRGPTSCVVIADRTGLTPSAVTKMVRRLEADGHVRRSTEPGRRAVDVALVPHAERDRRRAAWRREFRDAVRGIVDQERLGGDGDRFAVVAGSLVQLVSAIHGQARRLADAAEDARHRDEMRHRREAAGGDRGWPG